MTPTPLIRVIKLHSVGLDVRAVKRALKDSGETGFNDSATYGPYAVAAVIRFQKKMDIDADGVYGPATHAKLWPFFDATAQTLYNSYHPSHVLELPEFFMWTHQTGGLAGYPAIDCFAPGGTKVAAPCDGLIRKLSGHPVTAHATPGGPYGLSQYERTQRGDDFFLTHFEVIETVLNEHVKKGEIIGAVAHYTEATHGVTPSHIHMGKHSVTGSTTH